MPGPAPDGRVSIKINPAAASKKTRQRVKQGGPIFEFYSNTNRADSILVRSEKTGWMGWLPLREIEWSAAN